MASLPKTETDKKINIKCVFTPKMNVILNPCFELPNVTGRNLLMLMSAWIYWCLTLVKTPPRNYAPQSRNVKLLVLLFIRTRTKYVHTVGKANKLVPHAEQQSTLSLSGRPFLRSSSTSIPRGRKAFSICKLVSFSAFTFPMPAMLHLESKGKFKVQSLLLHSLRSFLLIHYSTPLSRIAHPPGELRSMNCWSRVRFVSFLECNRAALPVYMKVWRLLVSFSVALKHST